MVKTPTSFQTYSALSQQTLHKFLSEGATVAQIESLAGNAGGCAVRSLP